MVLSDGPNCHRPVVQTPGVYRDLSENPPAQAQVASFADLPWWQVFQDPQLQELIRTALKENYDLQLATERIAGARAQVAITPLVCFRRYKGMPISGAERTQAAGPSSTFWA
jgi:outer membrane protein TolC